MQRLASFLFFGFLSITSSDATDNVGEEAPISSQEASSSEKPQLPVLDYELNPYKGLTGSEKFLIASVTWAGSTAFGLVVGGASIGLANLIGNYGMATNSELLRLPAGVLLTAGVLTVGLTASVSPLRMYPPAEYFVRQDERGFHELPFKKKCVRILTVLPKAAYWVLQHPNH
jgi:hypothetical protein